MPCLVAIFRQFISLIDSLNEWIGRTISWLTLLMVLVTFAIVVLRYAFNLGWVAMQESVLYMYALVFLLGAAYTLKHDGHVRVDIIYQLCGVKTRAWIDFFGTLLLLMPVVGFIFWSSWEYAANSWEIKESSRNSGGLPYVYLLKACIPIMAGLLLLQGIALTLQSLLTALGIDSTPEKLNG